MVFLVLLVLQLRVQLSTITPRLPAQVRGVEPVLSLADRHLPPL